MIQMGGKSILRPTFGFTFSGTIRLRPDRRTCTVQEAEKVADLLGKERAAPEASLRAVSWKARKKEAGPVSNKIESWFGELDGLLIKFVPIREGADFEGYPFHQPGFRVADVRKVIALAEKYGGRKEGPIRQSEGETRAAVRDPDGNTIELYQRP
ncbi:MAG TPA: VOC family protein [Acidobacteriota bacterium]|nr:VOC family protein [Acidobacteriota bacterium]